MIDYNSFDSIQIGLASTDKILEWSRGEVKKPETINYRTLKPEKDGLFCERIFGPMKDGECHCGKYKKNRYKGIICDKCGVEVTSSKVRRQRMGHIELAAPVSHIWYFKGIPSRMGLLLDIAPRSLEKVLYFAAYIVIDPKNTMLSKNQILTEKEYRDSIEMYGSNSFSAKMGAEAVQQLLKDIDIESLSAELREEISKYSKIEKEKSAQTVNQKKLKLIKRLEVVEAFRLSSNKPEWMIMNVIPVIPPDIRPMVQLDGGRFATSDLNDLYRRVLNRNNRLKRLIELEAPDIIVRNEKRMLQEAVDALMDNGRRGRPVTGPGNRPLKSLSDMLRGKQGRFRQNLLGKRVDYSGRSVIVVGPELKMYQCGLPKEMALELFKPFVMKKLVEDGHALNIKSARKKVERISDEVWDVLEFIIKEHPVLLNRAPTLHRLGIQAFEPVLVEGRAIKLHPLVCTAYNADFDGDQMAVHVPLSVEAQAEARFLMLSANNLLAPKDGKPICVPTQDMILGSYYLTLADPEPKEKENIKSFSSVEEALMAYEYKHIDLHSIIRLRRTVSINGVKKTGVIKTTVGRVIFNEAIPQDIGIVDRSKEKSETLYEVDFLVGRSELGEIIDKCIKRHGTTKSSEVLDRIKNLGFRYSTKGAITVSVADVKVPEAKSRMIEEAEKKVDFYVSKYRKGLLSEEEKHNNVVETWREVGDELSALLMDNLGEHNPIYMMSKSGARGNISQIKQLAGMRGLMSDTSGRTIEIPVKSNFREGLNVLEFFTSSHGTRKSLADTALRTADSGYLTRRLVDVSQDVIVREVDCGSDEGITVAKIGGEHPGSKPIETLAARIIGRHILDDIKDPKTGKKIISKGEMVTDFLADKIEKAGIESVRVKSVLTCKSRHGVCSTCYGSNLSNGELCNIGEAVGIIAAQSIGEPGTQLTMRTFHTGGVAGNDITQGLPRVEELFEARKPKGLATLSEISGVVSITDNGRKKEVNIKNSDTGEIKTYSFSIGTNLKFHDGDAVEVGDILNEGSVSPQDLLKLKGMNGVQQYLIQEVQKVYTLQGVEINDKHIEVIVRQMFKKVKVDDAGQTSLLPGVMVDFFEFSDQNEEAAANGLEPATGTRTLLGITKASLATESFLSAASFQETTRVLTEAAIKGKVDPLVGLKENVIIGKLIPAGTGMSRYKDIDITVEGEILEVSEELELHSDPDDGGENPNSNPEQDAEPVIAVIDDGNDEIIEQQE